MEITLYRIMLFGLHIEKLKQFYMDCFGFLLVEEIQNEWVVLQAGPMELALHKIGEEYRNRMGEDFKVDSNTKLVFRINADLSVFRQQLIDNGATMRDIKSFPGIHSLFCDGEDMEGNVFQIEQPLDSVQ
jgi:hypothetical protein